jgi:nucleotide-binding universal stress UspA family protein
MISDTVAADRRMESALSLTPAGRRELPQHSQSFEGWFAGTPGLKVLAPATTADAKGLLKAAIRDEDPVLVIENLRIYTLRWAAETGMPVIVVRVLDPRPRPPGADRPNDGLGVDDAALVLGEHAAVASRRLADCAWRAELVEARSPAAGLAAAARHHRATAIVVGSDRRGGGHTVLGNQSHELLANADAPIVVVPAQAAARLLGSGESCAVTEIAC